MILCALCLATTEPLLHSPAAFAADSTFSIHVPAGPLPDALAALSTQTGISVGFSGAFPDVTSKAVDGQMSADDALQRLLQGSGLTARRVGPKAYRLEQEAVGSAVAPAATPASPAVRPSQGPEEMLVTAMKRPQDLGKLPASVAVIRFDDDAASPALPTSGDVAARSVGLTLTNLGPGRDRAFIRGVADSPFNGPSQSTVSIQMDEARLTYDAPDPDLRLVDIERVEILKGPQGPLYGTGALGGIFHIVTAKPDLEQAMGAAHVSGSLVEGGGAGGSGDLMLNMPIIPGRLGLRGVAYRSDEPGWIDNSTGRTNANDSQIKGGRLALRWQAAQDWTLDLGGAIQLLEVGDSQYLTATSSGLTRSGILPEPQDNDLKLLHATLNGMVGNLPLTVTSSWVRHEVDSTLDASAGASAFGLEAPLLYYDRREYEIFNEEMRLTSAPDAPISWLLGVSYLAASSNLDGLLGITNSASQLAERLRQDTREIATFGEISAPLTNRLRATAGARVFRSVSEDEARESGISQTGRTTKRAVSPSLSLGWQAGKGRFFFLRYAGAFRPAGIAPSNGTNSGRFESDELSNIEAGTRLRLAGGQLAIESAAYLTLWHHLQSDYLLDNGIVARRNAGDAHIYGLEATLHWMPMAAWSFELGFTAQHARLTRPAEGLDLDGTEGEDRRLPTVPDFSGHISGRYEFAMGSWETSLSARANYAGPSRLSFDPGLDRAMGDYMTVSAALSAQRDGWSVSLLADNLGNVRGDTFAFGNPFSVRTEQQYTPLKPRSIMLTLGRSW